MKLAPSRLIRSFSRLFALAAVIVIIWGIFFALATSYYIPAWVPIPFLFLGIAVILSWAVSTGFVRDLEQFVEELNGKSLNTDPNSKVKPVEFANIHLRLDDPEHKTEFERFLDLPIFESRDDPDQLITSNELAEEYVLTYVREYEERYNEQVSVGTEVKSGSFIVDLDVWGNAYTLVADYHDIIMGALLLQKQIRFALTRISREYHARTDGSASIDSDISLQSKSKVAASADEAGRENSPVAANNNAMSPVTVNTFSQPSSDKDMNINVNFPNQNRHGCLGTILLISVSLLLLLMIFCVVYVFCGYLDPESVCRNVQYDISNRISSFLIRMAIYVDNASYPR